MIINDLSMHKNSIGLFRPYGLFFRAKIFVGALGPSLFCFKIKP